MLLSTFYEVCCMSRSQQMKLLWKAFSIYSNCKTIFSLKVSSLNEIRSLHGIRALSIMWIVLTHTYIVSFWQVPTVNGQEVIGVGGLMSDNKRKATILKCYTFSGFKAPTA